MKQKELEALKPGQLVMVKRCDCFQPQAWVGTTRTVESIEENAPGYSKWMCDDEGWGWDRKEIELIKEKE
jgi:hypothetical protein